MRVPNTGKIAGLCEDTGETSTLANLETSGRHTNTNIFLFLSAACAETQHAELARMCAGAGVPEYVPAIS